MTQPEWVFLGVPIANGAGTDVVRLTMHEFELASLIGRYLSDVGRLASGQMAPVEFSARWSRQPVGGVQLEWRSENVVQAMRQAGRPPGVERYRKSVRRGPR